MAKTVIKELTDQKLKEMGVFGSLDMGTLAYIDGYDYEKLKEDLEGCKGLLSHENVTKILNEFTFVASHERRRYA